MSSSSHLARTGRLALAALLAGSALPLLTTSTASATETATAETSAAAAVACEGGLLALEDFSFIVSGDDELYTSVTLNQTYAGDSAPGPLGEVQVLFDPDHDGEADAPDAYCTRGFQLDAYQTEGATWATTGTQTWIDGDGATISAESPTATLSVDVPECYHQSDLSSQGAEFSEDDYFDGTGNPVPHYPDVTIPGRIGASNGGTEECVESGVVTPGTPTVAQDCAAGGVLVTLPATAGVIWSVDGEVVTEGTTLVEVAEDAAYSIEVTAAPEEGTEFTEGAQTEWTFDGVLDCVEAPPTPVTPAAPTMGCVTGGMLVTLPQQEGVAYSVDGTLVTTPATTVPVAEDAPYSVVVTAAATEGYVVEEGAQSTWTLTGTRDCEPAPGGVLGNVIVAPSDTAVAGTKVPAANRSARLARTGAEAPLLLAASGGLLVLGGGMLLLARRRREV